MYKTLAALLLLAPLFAAPATAGETPRPENAYLYIGWPNDGEVLRSRNGVARFRIWFGLRRMGVAPAGVNKPNTGHHHLLINTGLPPMDQDIPADRNHIHFGAGQTVAYIELPKGTHTLQLLMGDHEHIPHDPPLMSRKITVYVK